MVCAVFNRRNVRCLKIHRKSAFQIHSEMSHLRNVNVTESGYFVFLLVSYFQCETFPCSTCIKAVFFFISRKPKSWGEPGGNDQEHWRLRLVKSLILLQDFFFWFDLEF